MKKILITGANGQLGQCFKKAAVNFQNFEYHFATSGELDITSKDQIQALFQKGKFDVCINCAAYTKVDEAEKNMELAFNINALAAKYLADICKKHAAVLVHFSTDYVFDGTATTPYKEIDPVNPINVYGASKLAGEQNIRQVCKKYYIFRTSWLYSEFGHNFFRTILKKAEEKQDLNIVTSQRGTPTNANDLANYVLQILNAEKQKFGLYHFSNKGEATWYDFAEAILKFSGNAEKIKLEKSDFYKTPAERPNYSVLSNDKIRTNFSYESKDWKESLKDLVAEVS
ncbi:dTDP-4-dehydrorhamnose reductase [Gramella sp. AN32]|uniref:dTDP-4-dehydrorhamnose reductase n=1 Tax=Christiangramia antarctica TaxID=2058158 RepID=A0ABW5X140_9FLAO|nr:dTDP-4-dehydrorhamnose reductase [Gramella sp. AN32]MCM4155019.1 dTDP-4-dehydrorhamnose reductase [Gramella sp. AN32]